MLLDPIMEPRRAWMLVRISTPYFVAGGVIGGRFAPILGYMQGWSIHRIIRYCDSRGWELEVLDMSEKM